MSDVSVNFTRDEVILALDVLYSAGEERLSAQSSAIVELSDLLNRLPIHPVANRGKIFRNPHGVWGQLYVFIRSCKTGKRDPDVGSKFYDIAEEFEGRHDELHAIAYAIRSNLDYYNAFPFGSEVEMDGFPEGALLGHLHRVVEIRDGSKIKPADRCCICQVGTQDIYKNDTNLITMHLCVPVTELIVQNRYHEGDFIAVCPNCHSALHRYRPWLTKETCFNILR